MKSIRRGDLVPVVAFAVSALLFMLLMGRFGRLPNIDTDETFFKAAGRELAASGRFAAPELNHILGVDPSPEEIWLLYPPFYPVLFGAFVKIFGFGWKQCVLFDAAIKVALAAATWSVTQRLSPNRGKWLPFAAALSTMLMARSVAGRPDELAVAFGMAGLIPLIKPVEGERVNYREAIISGLLFGLCASTSTVAAIVMGLVALVWFIARSGGVDRFIKAGMIWAAMAGIPIVLLVVPILWHYPQSYKQYLANARFIFHNDTRTHWHKITVLFQIGWRISAPVLGILALGIAKAVVSTRHCGVRRLTTIWLGPIAGALFIFLIDPHLYTYLWFLGPYAVAAAWSNCSSPRVLSKRGSVRGAYVAVLILLVALGSMETVRHTLISVLAPAEQSLEYNAHRVRRLVPQQRVVLSYDAWWFLATDNLVYVPSYISRPYWDRVEYVVLKRLEELGPELEKYVREHFQVIDDNRNPNPVDLFGFRLSRSSRGFGMLILARRPKSDGMSDRAHTWPLFVATEP